MSSIPPNEMSLAQRAVKLIKQNNVGALSTHSVKHDGFPFASLANYSTDRRGQPVFFVSSMATHSKNIRANAKAALLVTELESSGDLASGRLTLMGTVVPIERDAFDANEIRDAYLRSNPNAQEWISFGDFQFYRLELVDVYLVAGFGVMGWVTPDDFKSAASEFFILSRAGSPAKTLKGNRPVGVGPPSSSSKSLKTFSTPTFGESLQGL